MPRRNGQSKSLLDSIKAPHKSNASHELSEKDLRGSR